MGLACGWRDRGVGLSLRRYYGVYACCGPFGLLMVTVETRPAMVRRIWPRALVNLAIVPGRPGSGHPASRRSGGSRGHPRQLHAALHARADVDADDRRSCLMAIAVRPRLASALPSCRTRHRRRGLLVCVAILSSLSATASSFGQRNWLNPQVWWRNSTPGVDLLAFAPNPLHPGWLAIVRVALVLPGGFNENVARCVGRAHHDCRRGPLTGYRPLKGWSSSWLFRMSRARAFWSSPSS